MSWVNTQLIENAPEDTIGFVYRVTNKSTGMYYVGIKKIKKRIKRKPLKGKKRMRIDYVDSDWRTYNTSRPELQKALRERPDDYVKEIVWLCSSVSELKAREAYYVLTEYLYGNWDALYNEVVNLRVRLRK